MNLQSGMCGVNNVSSKIFAKPKNFLIYIDTTLLDPYVPRFLTFDIIKEL